MAKKITFILGCIGLCVVCFGSQALASSSKIFDQTYQVEPEKKLIMYLINKNVTTHKAFKVSYNGNTENNVKSGIVRSIIEELKQYRKENLRLRMNEYRRMLSKEKDILLNSRTVKGALAAK